MPAPDLLSARDLSLGYGGRVVVDTLSLTVRSGEITILVGPNASGKSTLLRGLARLLRPQSGTVLLDGVPLHGLRTRDVARILGLLPQAPVAPDGVTVADLVGRGRYPHQGWFRPWTSEDDRAVDAALEATGTADLAETQVNELSGGQRQRVWIAMTLAQQTDILLLDEPTTFLDLTHQIEVLDLLADLNQRRGTTIVMVLHDLNLAARYAHHLVAMKDGGIAAAGDPRLILTADLLRRVFGLDAWVVADPIAGTPLVVPVGRHHPPPRPGLEAAARVEAARP